MSKDGCQFAASNQRLERTTSIRSFVGEPLKRNVRRLHYLMSVEFDIRPSVLKNSELPFERLRLVQRLAELRLADISAGVVFVFAAWSAPAIMALRRITRLLSSIDLGPVDIIILDNDCMTADDMIRLFGHVFHGAGETLWIRDGRVIAELSGFQPESEPLIVSHARELL
jgi:hypothetical protein